MPGDLKNITDKFTQIDTKIIELLQCSSDDFLGLNVNFKELYRSSSAISKRATDMVGILSDGDTRRMMGSLEELYKLLRTQHSPILAATSRGVGIGKELLEVFADLQLQVKNLNQNLLTLQFLLANLNIAGVAPAASPASMPVDEIADSYSQLIGRQKYHNCKNLEKLQGLIQESIGRVEQYSNQLEQQVNLILDEVHTVIVLFADKQQEVSRRMPSLKAITDQIAESAEKIVTNLQYQDIIRQKIEHVQTSHRSLLQNLSDFDPNNGSQHLDYLSQIRDLANIQAALLVRANKEYQRAIEQITEKFRSVSEGVTGISTLCKELAQSQFNQADEHLADLSQKFGGILELLRSVPAIEQAVMAECCEMVGLIDQVKSAISKPDPATPQGGSGASAERLKKAPQQGNIVEQLKEVGQDVESTSGQIQAILRRLATTGTQLQSVCNDLRGENASIAAQGDIAEKITSIATRLKSQDEQVYELLNSNFKASTEMGTVVSGSIKSIKYYDFFEVRIVEIIAMLNEIFREIKGHASGADTADNAEYLKTLYTMESEHKIHEAIVKGGRVPEDAVPNEPEEEENEDVELF